MEFAKSAEKSERIKEEGTKAIRTLKKQHFFLSATKKTNHKTTTLPILLSKKLVSSEHEAAASQSSNSNPTKRSHTEKSELQIWLVLR